MFLCSFSCKKKKKTKEREINPQLRSGSPIPPIKRSFPIPMNGHSFRVHPWWSITISKRPVSSKNRLNLYGHSCNAVHSPFFCLLFVSSFFFCNLKYTQKADYHVCRYVQSNVQTCAVSLWGSNLHLVHSSSRMSRFCPRCKCRLGKCAIFGVFFKDTSSVGGNICCINTCCSSSVNVGSGRSVFYVTSTGRLKQSILFE